jgi:hypothetical protein
MEKFVKNKEQESSLNPQIFCSLHWPELCCYDRSPDGRDVQSGLTDWMICQNHVGCFLAFQFNLQDLCFFPTYLMVFFIHIYNILCECGRCCIGETSRPLEVHMKEHKYNWTQDFLLKSKLAQHAFEEALSIGSIWAGPILNMYFWL